MRTLPRLILLLLVVAAVIQEAYYYGRLPPRLGYGLAGNGDPAGLIPKEIHFALYGLLLGVVLLVFVGMPALLFRNPNLRIQMQWLAAAFIAFVLAGNQLLIRANLVAGGEVSSRASWMLVLGFAAFFVLWLVRLPGRLRRAGGSAG